MNAMPRTKHAYIMLGILMGIFLSILAALAYDVYESKKAEDALNFLRNIPTVNTTYERDSEVVVDQKESREPETQRKASMSEGSQDAVEDESEETSSPWLQLGDGKIATEPKAGYIYSCRQQFDGGGARVLAKWIEGNMWDPEGKVVVDGSVAWSNALFSITLDGEDRRVEGNGLPNHTTGAFPITTDDDAYQYDRNPNSITAQTNSFTLPANPEIAPAPSCVPMGMIGISLSGVAIFSGLDGLGQDAVAREVQDACGGHPDGGGEYHYHGPSECLLEYAEFLSTGDSTLVGYALDGFGIYSTVENGGVVTNNELDACHGHQHTLEWNGIERQIYHYHMTQEYPYTVGCFRGVPLEMTGSDSQTSTSSPTE